MSSKNTDEVVKREKKLDFRGSWREISRKQKGLMGMMIALLVMSVVLLIIALVTLRPQSTVDIVVGYNDGYEAMAYSGGYRWGSWITMLAFAVLAVVFGVVHNFITLRIYRKYGREMALLFIILTMLLIVGAVMMILRLVREQI